MNDKYCWNFSLVLLDGLNENFHFLDWADWLQPLFEEHLAGMYRVVVTCWPNWWEETLFGLVNLTPPPKRIDVRRFNDAELNGFLASMNAARSDFPRAVLELMRVPRLSTLTMTYRQTLQESGDVTAERVIYEDWKDRLRRRGPAAGLSDIAMRGFVAELGRKLQDNIERAVTRKDIIQSLSERSGKTGEELQPAVAELTSGSWLLTGNNPDTFRVATDRIPFVLGTTLVSEIRKQTSTAAVESTIAEFLDPLKSHSLGASILCAATTIALLDDDFSPGFREVLLSKWLSEHNFHAADFDAFWRLAGLDPHLFLDLAEARWLAHAGTSSTDEVLIKTAANASEFFELYDGVDRAYDHLVSYRLARSRRLAAPEDGCAT